MSSTCCARTSSRTGTTPCWRPTGTGPGGGSRLAAADQEGLDRLIAEVGARLQGPGGAGIFLEQQESIAEMMLDPDGRVLSHFDFRRRLLELPGWEQFTALFLFYISEDDRLDGAPHEVQATTDALGRLDARLAEICARSSGSRA